MNKNTWILLGIAGLIVIGGAFLLFAGSGSTNNGQVPADTTNGTSAHGASSGSSASTGSGTTGGSTTDGEALGPNEPVPAAAEKARTDLSVKLSLDEDKVVILNVTNTTWSDACLGLPKSGETCAQTLTPGYRVELLADGKTYIYRTDTTGMTMRSEAAAE